MKRNSRRRKTSVKKIPRGGFAMPGGLNKPIIQYVQDGVVARAKKSNHPLKSAAKDLLDAAVKGAGVKIGETTVEILKDSLMGDGQKVVGTESTRAVLTKSNPGLSGKTYRTKFSAGRASTKMVNTAERMNGARKFTYSDTVVDIAPGALRKELSPISGFNRKGVIGYAEYSYWSFNDLFGLMGTASYVRPTLKEQRSYFMSKNFGTVSKVMNQNKYLNVKVTCRWVRQLLSGQSPNANLGLAFTSSTPTITSVEPNTIPYNHQMVGRTQVPNYTFCPIDPVYGNLNSSAAFRENFEVVKTMTKTLNPGDIWEIDYCHHTGPGLVFEDMYDRFTTATTDEGHNELAAAFYYPIFEFSGPQVEAFDSLDALGQNSIIGTSPCAMHFEFRKYAEIVQRSQAELSKDTTISQGGFFSTRYAVRTFTKAGPSYDTGVMKRRFSLPVSSILKAGEAPFVDKYIIPVTTDYTVDRGGRPNLS